MMLPERLRGKTPPILEVKFGNNKLPKSTAIFNVGGAHDCASDKLGLCSLGISGNCRCYALKPYRNAKIHQAFYNRQKAYWMQCAPSEFVYDFLRLAHAVPHEVTHLRINETGDFVEEHCVERVEKIAALLFPDILVYGYTHRSDLPWDRCRYFVVNASSEEGGVDDWSGKLNGFRAVDKPSGLNFVCPGDCDKCHVCTFNHGRLTEVVKH